MENDALNNEQTPSEPKKRRFPQLNKQTVKAETITVLLILLGSLLRAANIHIFILPNEFAPGGVTGISAMLKYVTGWSSGVFLLMFNLPLVILSAFMLNKPFAARTLISSLTTSGALMLADLLAEKGITIYQYNTSNPILAALAGGILSGVSLAILLKSGSSTGGVDIVAAIIHKRRPHMNVNWLILLMDAAVVFSSVFVYKRGLDPMMLAFILIFVSSVVSDTILSGFKSAIKFEIVTTNPEAVSKEIMEKLHRGVTMMPAVGMYKHEERALLVCIVSKRQTSVMQKIVRDNNDTFCFVSPTSEVYGTGFSSRH